MSMPLFNLILTGPVVSLPPAVEMGFALSFTCSGLGLTDGDGSALGDGDGDGDGDGSTDGLGISRGGGGEGLVVICG